VPLDDEAPRRLSGDALAAALAAARYRHPFRRYQRLALDAFERQRAAGARRVYLVLPPGAGKTALGWEIARRAGRRTLVLCPNTAVQAQWLRQWADFEPRSAAAAADRLLTESLTVLTYHALCAFDAEHEGANERALDLWRQSLAERERLGPDEAAAAIAAIGQADQRRYRRELAEHRRRARALLARGAQREELLALLHRNGRETVARAKATGPYTLVLDECHHLLEMWGYLVRALVEELGPETLVVGLTATPPELLDERRAALHRDIFGHADLAVPTPAVVREGDLAPYQELAYLVEPLPHERDFLARQHERFHRLTSRLLDPDFATTPFVVWLRHRVDERRSRSGARVGWTRFEQDDPALALAALRFMNAQDLELPADARLGERHRQPPTADDWAILIGDFALRALRPSADPRDAAAWEEVRRALPPLGYVLTAAGVRRHASPADRVVARSASKALAVVAVLEAEQAVLRDRLRALVLCDHERASAESGAALRGVLDPQAGSAAAILRALAGDAATAALCPLLVTARTVACARSTAVALWQWLVAREPALAATPRPPELVDPGGGWDDVVELVPNTAWWRSRTYVPLVTAYFEEGHSRCLIGTRALLGEGWDAPRVNVVVDLTTAGTSTAVHQMRGRSLRLDRAWPEKVADNWDVVCVDPSYPGGGADYDRFVRKHSRYFAPTVEGEIESGVSHVDHALSPYGPPSTEAFATLNARMVDRVADRPACRVRWRIGEPYANARATTLRVRFGRSVGVPGRRPLRHLPGRRDAAAVRARVGAGGAAAVAAAAALGWAAPEVGAAPLLAASLGGTTVAAGSLLLLGRWVRGPLARLGPSDTLEDLAAALADALRDAQCIAPDLGAHAVRVAPQADGYHRCYLDGATADESALFAGALDELLAPLARPRYLIPRDVAPERPSSALSAAALALRWAVGGRIGDRVVYHAVPDALAGSRARVDAFERAWHRHVSQGRALFHRDPRAQAVIELQRGENPFAVTSQLRELWR
jgi:superfamily II DNA or RNA helicase